MLIGSFYSLPGGVVIKEVLRREMKKIRRPEGIWMIWLLNCVNLE